ncbi:unnamed protein product [Closterium sp. NIES-65]|nr:unnamed protein product [Closterium sp. NIES-65]
MRDALVAHPLSKSHPRTSRIRAHLSSILAHNPRSSLIRRRVWCGLVSHCMCARCEFTSAHLDCMCAMPPACALCDCMAAMRLHVRHATACAPCDCMCAMRLRKTAVRALYNCMRLHPSRLSWIRVALSLRLFLRSPLCPSLSSLCMNDRLQRHSAHTPLPPPGQRPPRSPGSAARSAGRADNTGEHAARGVANGRCAAFLQVDAAAAEVEGEALTTVQHCRLGL